MKRLLAILLIYICCAGAWVLLGTSLMVRTAAVNNRLSHAVSGVWGPPLVQAHPTAHYKSPASRDGRRVLTPAKSRINVNLQDDPRRKGLLWYRTYAVEFAAEYEFENPTPISQTVYIAFPLPASNAEYQNFRFELDTDGTPAGDGELVRAVQIPAGERRTVRVGYTAMGTDSWRYEFGESQHVRDFELVMTTNFHEINIPDGTTSTRQMERTDTGYRLTWSYPEVRGLSGIGMDMPSVVNPGPVAARMTFFAPVSLLFFFTVLYLVSVVRGKGLHPVNYFFLGAGCFAFQLLFAYLVDLINVFAAFSIAAVVSMVLVSGYIWLVGGAKIGLPAAVAQFGYMILFSASFFVEGLTGIIITSGAIVTLALLMLATARVNWARVFSGRQEQSPGFPVR